MNVLLCYDNGVDVDCWKWCSIGVQIAKNRIVTELDRYRVGLYQNVSKATRFPGLKGNPIGKKCDFKMVKCDQPGKQDPKWRQRGGKEENND